METSTQSAKQLKLNKLCLTRSHQKILNEIEADLPVPGVTVLLGANGAGKSTLLQVLAGTIQCTTGHIHQSGLDRAFLMPEPAVFYPQLTVQEQLSFVAQSCANMPQPDLVDEAIQIWQLASQTKRKTAQLSLGYRQRLSMAQLMVSQADLLLLDEPMNGMDPEVLAVFKQQMQLWKQNKSIIMATHIMHEAQEMADWVVVMHQGSSILSTAYNHDVSFNELYQSAVSQFQSPDMTVAEQQ